MVIVTKSTFMYERQEKGQQSHISYNEAAPLLASCLSGNSHLRDKRTEYGWEMELAESLDAGIKSRTLGEDKGCFLPGTEV